MTLDLNAKEFRYLLDLVYIGNWIINSSRGDDRIEEYDAVESHLFSAAGRLGLRDLSDWNGQRAVPSGAYADGGVHEVIMQYEDSVFFEILAEELARRDLLAEGKNADSGPELESRIESYIGEFEANGMDNIVVK